MAALARAAEQLLGEFKAGNKKLKVLPGPRGAMSVASLCAQEAWVFSAAAEEHRRVGATAYLKDGTEKLP